MSLAYLLWALGAAFVSGADTALLYDILHSNEGQDSFKKYQGMARLFALSAVSFSALAGGYIASFSLGATFLLSAAAAGICFFFVGTISHEEKHIDRKEPYWSTVKKSLNIIRSNNRLIWFLVVSLFFAVTFNLFRPLIQIYMEQAHLNISLFGVASAYLFFVGAISSKIAHVFAENTKKFAHLLLGIFLILGVFMISFFVTPWGFLLFGIIAFASGINSILIEHEVLKNCPPEKHATVLSLNSLFVKVFFVILAPLFGYSLQNYGLQMAVGGTGIVLSALLLVAFVWSFFLRPVQDLHL